ncbi:MAG: hydroxyacid dehydrogenase [Chlorobi bacterium]|nr:hydroxyacid dehydrogenase [Chlorobiota bacterium]
MAAKPLILIIDRVHPLLEESLRKRGFQVETDLSSPAIELSLRYPETRCLVLRSRLPVDRDFLMRFPHLGCVVRVGSGLEGIDTDFAASRGIRVMNTPEGNRNAVGEHALGLLLNLMRHTCRANLEIRRDSWNRKANTGYELDGRTVGIIGYGNTGKAFARKLAGFDTEVLAYDIRDGVGDSYARQTGMDEIFERATVVSLHVPLTSLTHHLVNDDWIAAFRHPFWLINTSRGEVTDTAALERALREGKIRGAGLDVLEFEQKRFGNQNDLKDWPPVFHELKSMPNVLLTPHIAGLTRESYEKLALAAVDKISRYFNMNNENIK